MPLFQYLPAFRGLNGKVRSLRGEEVILVTGGAGFIGTHLCGVLLELGYRVIAVDNFITGRRENLLALTAHERFHFLEMDITSPEFIKKLAGVPLGRIFHLACPTGVPNIERLSMEMLLTCSRGTHHVLELARMHGASLFFTSSCEVYGQPEVIPQKVSYNGNVNPVGPRCPYEEGKRFSESLVITYVRKHGLDAKIVRIFNTYGPGMSPDDQRVLPRFLQSVCRDAPLTIYGSGQQTRTFLFVEDCVRGFLTVMEKGKTGEVYNIGGTEPITMRDLADLVIAMTNHTKGIVFLPHFTEDHTGRLPAVAKLLQLGWQPRVGLEEGIKRMIEDNDKMPLSAVTGEKVVSTVAA